MFTKLDQFVQSYKVNKNNPIPAFIVRDGLQNIVEDIQDEINQLLPHGSGIDNNWVIEHQGDMLFECYNSYHAMDGNGFYCGWIDFTVTFNAITKEIEVETDKKQAKAIEDEYMSPDQDECCGDCFDYCPCPCFDDLEDMLYETVEIAVTDYLLLHTLKYAKKFYPVLFEKIANNT
jgi:hypothetical protein